MSNGAFVASDQMRIELKTEYGLWISKNKTKVGNRRIRVVGENLEQEDRYKYLCAELTQSWKTRIGMATEFYNIIINLSNEGLATVYAELPTWLLNAVIYRASFDFFFVLNWSLCIFFLFTWGRKTSSVEGPQSKVTSREGVSASLLSDVIVNELRLFLTCRLQFILLSRESV